eukprot:snap_masked-scaffold447_size167621-processed-gene-0.7 protein:Tk02118 transcript:snap_masked-scaffold447_size167621-processed-gene-0.7-mRNA-1 annotation:"mitochondrial ornithine transporter"
MEPPGSREFAIDLFSGMCAGVVNVLVGLPMDTVKVKMQTFPKDNPTIVKTFYRTVRADGLLRGLYAGALPSLMANVGENAILFVAYGQCQRMVARACGLRHIEDLHPVGNAVAGSCSAFFSAMWLCPTEHVKCQLQVLRELRKRDPSLKMVGPFKLTRNILREEGVQGLFLGLKPTWSREIPGYFCFFFGYEAAKIGMAYGLGESKDELGVLPTMLCGSVAGVCFWTGIFPIDSVKSRIQVMGKEGTMREIAAGIYRAHGIRGFYRGWLPAVVRAFPATASLLATYEFCRPTARMKPPTPRNWFPLAGESQRPFSLTVSEVEDEEEIFEFMLLDEGRGCLSQRLTASAVLERNRRDNPAVEASAADLMLELVPLMSHSSTSVELKPDLSLKIQGQLHNYDFYWRFQLAELPSKRWMDTLSSELVEVLAVTLARQEYLVDLIKRKDLEIYDYAQSGTGLSRKSLETEKFDPQHLERIAPAIADGRPISFFTSDQYKAIQKSLLHATPATIIPSPAAQSRHIRIEGRKVGEWRYGNSDDDEDEAVAGSQSPLKRPTAASGLSAKSSLAKKLKKLGLAHLEVGEIVRVVVNAAHDDGVGRLSEAGEDAAQPQLLQLRDIVIPGREEDGVAHEGLLQGLVALGAELKDGVVVDGLGLEDVTKRLVGEMSLAPHDEAVAGIEGSAFADGDDLLSLASGSEGRILQNIRLALDIALFVLELGDGGQDLVLAGLGVVQMDLDLTHRVQEASIVAPEGAGLDPGRTLVAQGLVFAVERHAVGQMLLEPIVRVVVLVPRPPEIAEEETELVHGVGGHLQLLLGLVLVVEDVELEERYPEAFFLLLLLLLLGLGLVADLHHHHLGLEGRPLDADHVHHDGASDVRSSAVPGRQAANQPEAGTDLARQARHSSTTSEVGNTAESTES